ncbi:uncharacterized protein LOC113239545 [Hyposmocoma kahamanoa]|uniref:uncharacterized protein LOC113239545 n=1 Tax=Hyposmocoma kahamanoa TaxID=1477025 RepID=UPI000E6D9417|nr:uncharacterized protein LOC113239545 [Hyposmocoma kahamanoa]
MKTLVVLSALTAIAIAAPALSENRYVGYSPVSYQITPTFRREKKSATETSHNARHLSEVQQLPLMETNHVTKVSGRTFGLKKPIIVKNNKLGYHLYRNSEEEQAQIDPQEKCTKEVKVKLCDSENSEARSNDLKANSTCKTDLHNSKSDIMQSIKTAKQAVEKLQHMKHDWKHNTLGSDAEVHKNIEVARLALEHIQQNFGNLETMNMQATNAEDLQDAKEERITQWMEAINNIQKNSEIARNLEDGFIASNNQDHNMDQRKSNNELDNVHNHEITIKSSSHDEQSNMDKLEAKTEHEVTHQDMKAELSETKEAKFDHKNTLIARVDMPVTATEEVSPNSSFITNSDLDKNIESEAHGKAKNSELDFNSKHPVAEDHKMPSEPKEPRAMAAAEVIKMEMDKIKQSNKAEKALESAIGTLQKSSMKSTESKADFVHHNDMNSQSKGFDEKNSKSAWMESKDNDMLAKASEHIPTAIDTKEREMKTDLTHEKAGHVSAFTAMKSVEHHKNLEKQFIEDDQNHSHIEMKSSATSLTKMPERHDDNVAMKSADQVHNNEPANLKKGISSSALHKTLASSANDFCEKRCS